MIETITNIPLLIAATVIGAGMLALIGLVILDSGNSFHSDDLGSALVALAIILLVVGTPAAALISGITLSQIIVALASAFFFGGLAIVALTILGIVLFILGNVFIPVKS